MNIYQTNNHSDPTIDNILTSKKWIDDHQKEPLPIAHFPEIPKIPKLVINDKPVISLEKPVRPEPKPLILANRKPIPIVSQISPKIQQDFFLKNISGKKEISEQLPLIISNPSQNPESEEILLTRIKNLEEQLAQVQAENGNLKIEKEKAEQLTRQEKERADNYQQQLKVIIKTLKQWQKINYYQQLEQEQEAKIIQLPPNKARK